MNKQERTDLCRLIRRREKLAKAAADERASELEADFEQQMGTVYSYDNDATWKDAAERAMQVVEEAQKEIAKRCEELGIPAEFAPGLSITWYRRGENAIKDRRLELRKMAKTRIESMKRKAYRRIEESSVALQEQVVAHGIESDAARQFLEQMPAANALMPPIDVIEVSVLLGCDKKGAA